MSETVAAPNPTEANTSQEPEAGSATVETKPGEQQHEPVSKTLLGSDDAKPGGDQAKPEEKPTETKPAGAPEKYEFKAAEGTEYDAKVLETFSAGAKDANLTQEAAQKLLDTMAPALATRYEEQAQSIKQGWMDASTADKEFGGEKLKENMGVAKKALDHFATPDLRKLLEETGLGNHPEVIRFMYRAGKAISEDTFVGGRGGQDKPLDAASILYPTMKKE